MPTGSHLHIPLGCRSMRAFAEEYKKRGWPLNVLLNNAAIQSPKGKRGAKTEDGFEVRPRRKQGGVAYQCTSVALGSLQ